MSEDTQGRMSEDMPGNMSERIRGHARKNAEIMFLIHARKFVGLNVMVLITRSRVIAP